MELVQYYLTKVVYSGHRGVEFNEEDKFFKFNRIDSQIHDFKENLYQIDMGNMKIPNQEYSFIERYRDLLKNNLEMEKLARLSRIEAVVFPEGFIAFFNRYDVEVQGDWNDSMIDEIHSSCGIPTQTLINNHLYREQLLPFLDEGLSNIKLQYSTKNQCLSIPMATIEHNLKSLKISQKSKIFHERLFRDIREQHAFRDIFSFRSNYFLSQTSSEESFMARLYKNIYKREHWSEEQIRSKLEADAYVLAESTIKSSSSHIYKHFIENSQAYESSLYDMRENAIANKLALSKIIDEASRINPKMIDEMQVIKETNNYADSNYKVMESTFESHLEYMEKNQNDKRADIFETSLTLITFVGVVSVINDGYDYVTKIGSINLNKYNFSVILIFFIFLASWAFKQSAKKDGKFILPSIFILVMLFGIFNQIIF